MGFHPDQILEMATVTTAAAIGLATTAGTLHAGYNADLLVVDGDSLIDLTALQRPLLVMARGRPHLRCRSGGILHSVMSGSAIGAVRHRGSSTRSHRRAAPPGRAPARGAGKTSTVRR
ncbi:MAG: amidohydrolase family protein [Pseudonocardiales bacterium]|nr:amidohydrolase family protein [Pseudonocardiales bacterium]